MLIGKSNTFECKFLNFIDFKTDKKKKIDQDFSKDIKTHFLNINIITKWKSECKWMMLIRK